MRQLSALVNTFSHATMQAAKHMTGVMSAKRCDLAQFRHRRTNQTKTSKKAEHTEYESRCLFGDIAFDQLLLVDGLELVGCNSDWSAFTEPSNL